MTSKLLLILLTSTFISGSLEAKMIGETEALIPEAGITSKKINDGESGNINFPHGDFKAIATIGERDKDTGLALTGYPDGNAAWLADDDTIRVVYQSESYATLGRAPNPETYPWMMRNGVTFSGSHIHTIDYDRKDFADFIKNKEKASDMVVRSGKLFDRVYNVFGYEVEKRNFNPNDLAAKWGNQTRADGTFIQFKDGYKLSQADYFFQSFCGAWYEPAEKYGKNIGFADDIWLTAEEWEIGRAFAAGAADTSATMGLASIAVDIKNGVAYTVPALGQTGYEKLMPINSGNEDFVVIVAAGYNHGQEPAPLKVYVGMKDRLPDGTLINYSTANERDTFLARNGLLYGKLYGMAVSNEIINTLVDNADPKTKMADIYLKDSAAPNSFESRWFPTSYQWSGFDKPVAVIDTEMMLWEADDEQPDGYTFFNGDSKTEHPAADPSGLPRYAQNMTQEGALLGVEFTDFNFGGDLPEYLDAKVNRMIPAIDGALVLEIGNEGKVKDGDASIHMEKNVAKMVAPDGLYWTKAKDGDFLIVDEDSGNDYGERKYIISIDSGMNVEDAYLLAISGGKYSSRYENGVSALGGAFTKPGTTEFSGSWNTTGLVARKSDGSFYSKDELYGTGLQSIIESKDLDEQLFIGVVQARPESSGDVEKFGSDAGGQVFQFTVDLK